MDLIASYETSDSEDETDPWARSRVSVKRCTSNDEERPLKRRPARLPQPSITLKAPVIIDKGPVSDNAESHDGKIRSFPHERGNWASHVHIPVDLSVECRIFLENLIKYCSPAVDLKLHEDFHVSLTRTFVLRHHWIDDFALTFRRNFSQFTSFSVYVQDIEIFVNDEKTRTFLALKVWDPSSTLEKLVDRANVFLTEFNLPTFYEDPSFHISGAWCVGDRKAELEKILQTFPAQLNDPPYQINEIHCKIGHLKYTCHLKQ